MKKISLALLTGFFITVSANAGTNDQAKINLTKKIFKEEKFSQYATPSFKKAMKEADKFSEKYGAGDAGCELYEHYALGLGNGGEPARNLKISIKNSNIVNASYLSGSEKQNIDLVMVCKGNSCQIDDVINNGRSFKQENLFVVSRQTC